MSFTRKGMSDAVSDNQQKGVLDPLIDKPLSPMSFEMDLHTYSRGMAYAAITCALHEIKTRLQFSPATMVTIEPNSQLGSPAKALAKVSANSRASVQATETSATVPAKVSSAPSAWSLPDDKISMSMLGVGDSLVGSSARASLEASLGPAAVTLTIITGRNVADRGQGLGLGLGQGLAKGEGLSSTSSSSTSLEQPLPSPSTSDDDKSYTLTTEVQRILIEDFYPPISSSTVPGNPGRLYITLTPPPVDQTDQTTVGVESSSEENATMSELDQNSRKIRKKVASKRPETV